PSVPPAPEPEPEAEHEGWHCGTTDHDFGRDEVWLGALGGPHATVDAVCDELAGWARRAGGWITTPCTRAPVPLPAGALASAWILRIGVGKQGRISDLGAYFLAIEREGAWYLEPSRLVVASAGPSRRHPISVTPLQGEIKESERGRKLGVLR